MFMPSHVWFFSTFPLEIEYISLSLILILAICNVLAERVYFKRIFTVLSSGLNRYWMFLFAPLCCHLHERILLWKDESHTDHQNLTLSSSQAKCTSDKALTIWKFMIEDVWWSFEPVKCDVVCSTVLWWLQPTHIITPFWRWRNFSVF